MINLEYILSQTLSPRPEILSETSSCMLTISPRTLLSVTSPAAAVAAAAAVAECTRPRRVT